MRNRWLIALAAIGLHISIGSVYAWSVLTRPIMADMGFTMSQTTWTFSLAILMLGLSAGFLGSFAEKIGPKKSGLLAMLFWVAGLLGTAYALSVHNLTLLYLFYGITVSYTHLQKCDICYIYMAVLSHRYAVNSIASVLNRR